MRAALYVRVSSEEQVKEGFSIQAQTSLLDRKCIEYGYTIVKHYVDDGYSAKNTKRPALQRMLVDAELKLFDVIFFWRLDRLTRSSRDFHKLAERMQKNSVGIRSATESIDTTTAIGRFQLELSVSLAQLERETISERVFFVMEERARKGMRNGSFAPLGYDLVDGKLVINEEGAKMVRRIFQMYLSFCGMKKIASTFNKEGILSTKGSLWSAPAVKYVLENPVYIGKVRYNYQGKTSKSDELFISDGDHEPIIDADTFERVQQMISHRKQTGKSATHDNIFSSVLKCGRCGKTMHNLSYYKKDVLYRSYKCSSKYDYGTCDMHNISEKAVVDAFLRSLNFEEMDFEKYFVDNSEEDDQQRFEDIKKELETVAARKKKWQMAYANDIISMEDLKERLDEERAKEEQLRNQLAYVPAAVQATYSKEEIINQLKHLKESWHLVDNNMAKKTFIQEAFEYIVIDTAPGSKVGQGFRIKVDVIDFKFRT